MNVAPVHNAPVVATPNDLERLKSEQPTTAEGEKARLMKAAKAFEAFFMYQMLQNMRKTVPEASFGEEGAFSGGLGKDIFTDLFDMQLAEKMVGTEHNSLSGMLYRSLEQTIEAPGQSGERSERIDQSFNKPAEPIPVPGQQFRELSEQVPGALSLPGKVSLIPLENRTPSVGSSTVTTADKKGGTIVK